MSRWVVEPVVNREKLRELLALETEYPTLDFKSGCDLGKKGEQVELAKDVGAMSVRGGSSSSVSTGKASRRAS